jgi:hypothetical protein
VQTSLMANNVPSTLKTAMGGLSIRLTSPGPSSDFPQTLSSAI